jgi:tensin
VLRLNKAQLDGACADDRFEDDFFIDLIFAPVTSKPVERSDSDTENTAVARRERGLVVEAEARDAYDEMLHRDSRFWDEVSNRKERAVSRRLKEKGGDSGGGVDDQIMNSLSSFGFDDEDHEDDEVAVEFELPSGGVGYRRGQQPNLDPKASAAIDFINEMTSKNSPKEETGGEAADLMEMLTMAGMDDEVGWVDTAQDTSQTSNSADQLPTPPVLPTSSGDGDLVKTVSTGDDELSALADLEKELGLDAPSPATTTTSQQQQPPQPGLSEGQPSAITPTTTTTTTTTSDNYDFDDDLDDFEGYLQSLTASPTNKE